MVTAQRLSEIRRKAYDTAWDKLDAYRHCSQGLTLSDLRKRAKVNQPLLVLSTYGDVLLLTKDRMRHDNGYCINLTKQFPSGYEGLPQNINEHWHWTGQRFWMVPQAAVDRFFTCYRRSQALRSRQTELEKAESHAR